jgi:preprotein translocase subunit SecE
MERSVTESPRTPRRRRIVRLAEGVLVGIAIFTLVVLGFDWLMAATP